MINIKKMVKDVKNLVANSQFSTDIRITFAKRVIGDDFDPHEKNYTYVDLNPMTIKGYVRDIKPEALVWKQYGLSEVGAKEVMVEDKYRSWFENASKIEINGDNYQVYKEAVGNRCLITQLPMHLLRIILNKVK